MFFSFFIFFIRRICLFNNNVFVLVDCDIPPGSPPPLLPSSSQRNYFYKGQNLKSKQHKIKINCCDALHIFILSLGVFTLLRLPLLHLCTHVSYVTFNTDLNLYSMKTFLLLSTQCVSTYLSLVVLGLLILSHACFVCIIFANLVYACVNSKITSYCLLQKADKPTRRNVFVFHQNYTYPCYSNSER